MSTVAYLSRLIPCTRCGAKVGEKCRTASGKRATYQHSVRTFPISQTWQVGYFDGLRDAVHYPDYAKRQVAHREAK